MYNRTFWLDHVEEGGVVVQQGTNMSQDNFNKEELGIFESWAAGLLLAQKDRIQGDANAEAEILVIALDNLVSGALTNVDIPAGKTRHTTSYNVMPFVSAIVGATAGPPVIVVSAKQANGFKVTATGTWTDLDLILYVQGGML